MGTLGCSVSPVGISLGTVTVVLTVNLVGMSIGVVGELAVPVGSILGTVAVAALLIEAPR